MTEYRRKLIEVALPLNAINEASAEDKSNPFLKGHPRNIHQWWARRPLAACRAVLFTQLVDDPSSLPEAFPTENAQDAERQRLFRIIEDLVKWDNMTNEAVLHAARVEIARSAARTFDVNLPHQMTPAEVAAALSRYAPPVLDPFAGGGSIPLEAQRLGLEALAGDLNPVAVLINKALIEIPPKFAGRPPVNPESRTRYLQKEWKGAQGLAEDVRYYSRWTRDRAWEQIGHLYPKSQLPKGQGGGEATVIAWLWARTVKCSNPVCGAQMPLISSYWLSKKTGKQAWIEPTVRRDTTPPTIQFAVSTNGNGPQDVPKVGRGAQFRCLACGSIASEQHIKDEANAGRMQIQMMAIVAEATSGRTFLGPVAQQQAAAAAAKPKWTPQGDLSDNRRHMLPPIYGMRAIADLFTPRQMATLTEFADLVAEARNAVLADSDGNAEYADAVATYLALAIDKASDYGNTLCTWNPFNANIGHLFTRQAVPITWDFAEANLMSGALSLSNIAEGIAVALEKCPAGPVGHVSELDASTTTHVAGRFAVATDPPYYDNVPYADLSDFFYVWLRHSLGKMYLGLFGTLLTPKTQELVADPSRWGNRLAAREFFESGLRSAFVRMNEAQNRNYPLSVYYAFKQSETDNAEPNTSSLANFSTGWESMLEALLTAEFVVEGTWPIRTERIARMRDLGSNALASSIVIVCRPREVDAPLTTRRDFLQALHRELPGALRDLQRGHIAPVDLAQAAIGPGMAVFSRYSRVLESDGTPMRVRTALQLINQTLDEVLAEQEGEYDADSRWAVAWFEQYGVNEGPYGVAETLSTAKNTAVGALVEAGIVQARGGKVRLVARSELPVPWKPAAARRLTAWEVTQRLIRALETEGEQGAAAILDQVGALGEIARDLAYRLYTVCERKKWADEALAYNSLVVEWTDISGAAEQIQKTTATQTSMF